MAVAGQQQLQHQPTPQLRTATTKHTDTHEEHAKGALQDAMDEPVKLETKSAAAWAVTPGDTAVQRVEDCPASLEHKHVRPHSEVHYRRGAVLSPELVRGRVLRI